MIISSIAYLYIVSTLLNPGAQLGGERGKVFPSLIWKFKKSALILENVALFVHIYGLNSHLKCNFKSVLQKKNQGFSLRNLSFVI